MFGNPEFFTIIKAIINDKQTTWINDLGFLHYYLYSKVINLRNFFARFNIFGCKKCNLWKTYILMFIINANGYGIRFAWMIEETAYVSIEIGINAKLQKKNQFYHSIPKWIKYVKEIRIWYLRQMSSDQRNKCRQCDDRLRYPLVFRRCIQQWMFRVKFLQCLERQNL